MTLRRELRDSTEVLCCIPSCFRAMMFRSTHAQRHPSFWKCHPSLRELQFQKSGQPKKSASAIPPSLTFTHIMWVVRFGTARIFVRFFQISAERDVEVGVSNRRKWWCKLCLNSDNSVRTRSSCSTYCPLSEFCV